MCTLPDLETPFPELLCHCWGSVVQPPAHQPPLQGRLCSVGSAVSRCPKLPAPSGSASRRAPLPGQALPGSRRHQLMAGPGRHWLCRVSASCYSCVSYEVLCPHPAGLSACCQHAIRPVLADILCCACIYHFLLDFSLKDFTFAVRSYRCFGYYTGVNL